MPQLSDVVLKVSTPRNSSVTPKTQEESQRLALVLSQAVDEYNKAVVAFKLCKGIHAKSITCRLTPEYVAADKLYCAAKIALGIAATNIVTDTSVEALKVFIDCLAIKDKLRNEGIIGKTETRIDCNAENLETARASLALASAKFNKAACDRCR